MVPASRAAAQIRLMFSFAVLVPRKSPTAVGFTETSAVPPPVSPSAPSLPTSWMYSSVAAAACAGSLVSSPR